MFSVCHPQGFSFFLLWLQHGFTSFRYGSQPWPYCGEKWAQLFQCVPLSSKEIFPYSPQQIAPHLWPDLYPMPMIINQPLARGIGPPQLTYSHPGAGFTWSTWLYAVGWIPKHHLGSVRKEKKESLLHRKPRVLAKPSMNSLLVPEGTWGGWKAKD